MGFWSFLHDLVGMDDRGRGSGPAAAVDMEPQMTTDWLHVLNIVAPNGDPKIIKGFANCLPQLCDRFALNTKLRQAHFLAQCAHESAGLRTTVEYASGEAYEGRKDLGNTQPGDGIRYKGRGLIQLTGRANYAAFGAALGVDLVDNPLAAGVFPVAALTAGLYWQKHNINAFADRDDVVHVTRAVNGGVNGLASREAFFALAKKALA